MSEEKYIRLVQTAVTNFLYCGNKYLFLKRNLTKRIDPGKMNGIGGRVEPGEDYLNAAIRETEEETGYKVKPEDIKLAGVVKLEGGYKEDWVMCFFKIAVPDMAIPLGNSTDDGELVWLDADEVMDSKYELVDDINYCFKDIVSEEFTFFMTAQVDDDGKVASANISRIKN